MTPQAKQAWRQVIKRFPDDLAAKAAAEYIERIDNPERFAPIPSAEKKPAAEQTNSKN